MSIINPTMPTPGDPRGAEEADLANAVQTLLNEFNGNIDNANIKAAAGIDKSKLAADVQGSLLPPGVILDYGGDVAPSGFLLCDGSEKAIATYGPLYAVLGTKYGALTNGAGGAGASHFRLPDFRGRVAVGQGQGAGLTNRTVGQAVGAEVVAAPLPAHSHGVNDPGHDHGVSDPGHSHGFSSGTPWNVINDGARGGGNTSIEATAGVNSFFRTQPPGTTSDGTGIDINGNATGISIQNAGAGDGSHANMQPSLVVGKIIKI